MKNTILDGLISSTCAVADGASGRLFPAAALSLLIAAAGTAKGADDVYWNESVHDGYIDSHDSWKYNGNIPATGDAACFFGANYNGAYTVKVPVTESGYYLFPSGLYVGNFNEGASFAFDAEGTELRVATDTTGVAWKRGLLELRDSANYLFFLGGYDASKENDNYGYRLTDGVLKFGRDSEGSIMTLESGTLDAAFLPDGVTPTVHNTRLLGSSGTGDRVVFKSGSVAHLRDAELYGDSPNGYVLVEGALTVWGGEFKLGSHAGSVSPLIISNGVLTVKSAWTTVGNNAITQDIIVSGTGSFVNEGGTVYCPRHSQATGNLILDQNASWNNGNSPLALGNSGGIGTLSMKDSSTFSVNNGLTLGDGANGTAVVTVEDDAVLTVNGEVKLSHGANANGQLNLLGGKIVLGSTSGITTGDGSVFHNGAGTSVCHFDGGTIVQGVNNVNIVQKMPVIRLGDEGVVVDTAGFNSWWSGKTEDVEGEDGLFVKTGAGTLTVKMKESNSAAQGDYAGRSIKGGHALTIVRGGTMTFSDLNDDNDCSFGRSFAIVDGATVSLAGGAKTLTVGDLVFGNGNGVSVLALDSGDTLVVTNTITVIGGQISGSWTAPSGNAKILVVKSPLDVDLSMTELGKISFASVTAGKDYYWTKESDEEFNLYYLNIADYNLTKDTTWQGSNAEWSGEGAWSADAPDRNTVVTFGESNSSRNVTVADGATAGKVVFNKDGFNLSGNNGLSVAAGFDVQTGDQTVSAPVALGISAEVNVAEGSKLTFAGDVSTQGAVTKKGAGGLAITQAQDEAYALSVAEGVVTLGTKGEDDVVSLSNLKISTDNTANTVAVVADSPVEAESFSRTSTGGRLVKGGAAPLTLKTSSTATVGLANVSGHEYAASFTLTDREVSASGAEFTVAEGDLVFKGTVGTSDNPASLGLFSPAGAIAVGVCTGENAGGATPRIVFDHVRFRENGHIFLPGSYGSGLTPWSEAGIVVTNGAYASLDSFHGFGKTSGQYPVEKPKYTIDVSGGSTCYVRYNFSMMEQTGGLGEISVRDGSYLLAGGNNPSNPGEQPAFNIYNGSVDISVSGGSHMGAAPAEWTIGAVPGRLSFGSPAGDAHIRFTEGSVLHCDRLSLGNNSPDLVNYLHFNNSEWTPGDVDCDFVYPYGNRLRVVAEESGLILSNSADRVWNFYSAITGTGDVVKKGEGRLVFQKNAYLTETNPNNGAIGAKPSLTTLTENQTSSVTLGITGTLRVQGGEVGFADTSASGGEYALDVSEGAVADLGGQTLSFTSLHGDGVVSNGTLTAAKIIYDADAALTFSDVAFDGALAIDFGCTEENPLDRNAARAGIVVAKVSGTTSLESTRIIPLNTGIPSAKAKAKVVNGDVVVTVVQSGFMVKIR